MSEINQIKVLKVVGSPLCVSSDDGNLVYEQIEKKFLKNELVELNFNGTETIISAFLNAAVGQLYEKFSEDIIRESLSIGNLSSNNGKRYRNKI